MMAHKKAPPVRHDDPEMTGQRARNITGELRRKRGDTLVGTLEELYHIDFGVRSDMQLDTLRETLGEDEIAKLIRKARG
ncbi:MAG: hypothetical protein L0338_36790 [Acidobacteria bacterium]|nr:hypothetical protein [Acidobacteriota bacterium]